VLVAERELVGGQTVTDRDVAVRRLPAAALPADFLHDPAQAIGRPLTVSLPAGATLLPTSVVTKNALAAPGLAVLPVTLTATAAGLVEVGDRIDLLAADADGGAAQIASAARVVAVLNTAQGSSPLSPAQSSGPVVLMARLGGVPTAICEQNSIPGLTNKILGRLVRRVFLSFEESRRFFKPKKIAMTGNPVRRELAARLLAAGAAARPADAPLTVLVSGGSLGAVAVNDLASQALIELAKGRPLTIVHQTGTADEAKIAARYREAGVAADVRAFIKDMAREYERADLIVCRAGATTVAELAIAAKPAIFIPYPFAADNHQEINAREMAAAGAALSYKQADLTVAALRDAIAPLLDDPRRRAAMGAAMRTLAKPGAAAAVVDWCGEVAKPAR